VNEWEWQLLEEHNGVESVSLGQIDVRKGDRVRLRPRKGGDVFDLALAGRLAIVEAIEQDYEGRVHLAVVVEDDPGQDLGMLRQPGHRFFFMPEEVEAFVETPQRMPGGLHAPKTLVAGIGDIFHGDDGFGIEVIQRLSSRRFAENVTVKDFGIRGYDLAYALLDDFDFVVLVDATSRGDAPGTLYVIELERDPAGAPTSIVLDAHALNPVSVLRLAESIGEVSSKILLVGCEPATLGGEEGHMGLSREVLGAADEAVGLIEKLLSKLAKEFEEKGATNGNSACDGQS
jgi:hydrogenase maturation protease